MRKCRLQKWFAFAVATAMAFGAVLMPACACAARSGQDANASCCYGDGSCCEKSDAACCCGPAEAPGQESASNCESGCACTGAHPEIALMLRDLNDRTYEPKSKQIPAQYGPACFAAHSNSVAVHSPIIAGAGAYPSPPVAPQTCALRC